MSTTNTQVRDDRAARDLVDLMVGWDSVGYAGGIGPGNVLDLDKVEAVCRAVYGDRS